MPITCCAFEYFRVFIRVGVLLQPETISAHPLALFVYYYINKNLRHRHIPIRM